MTITQFFCATMLIALSLHTVGVQAHGGGDAGRGDNEARQIRFPDVPGKQTLVADLHTHSVFSDGHVWPNIRVGEALRDGLDAMAVTEHLEYQPHLADIPHPDRNRAYAATLEAAEETDLMIISGSEITRDPPAGHINAVFLKDANKLLNVRSAPRDRSDTAAYYKAAGAWPAEKAVAAANDQGAFVFWNHPYWTRQQPDGKAALTEFHEALIDAKQIHGIEIANGRTYSEEAFSIALRHNLTLIGVSDVHNLIDWDYEPHNGGHRPVTLVFADERTPQALQKALFERATVVWFKNLLIGRQGHLIPLLDASLSMEDLHYLPDTQVLAATLHNASGADLMLQNTLDLTFMHHADMVEVPAHGSTGIQIKAGPDRTELTLEFAVNNALIEPGRHPLIQLNAKVGAKP